MTNRLLLTLFYVILQSTTFATAAVPDDFPWVVSGRDSTSGGSSGVYWLYDSNSGKIQPLRGGVYDPRNISPDGRYLYTYESHRGDTIFLYDMTTGQLKHRFRNKGTAVFSPDSQWMAVGKGKDHVLYRLSTGEIAREIKFTSFFDSKTYLSEKSLYDTETGNLLIEFKSIPVWISHDRKTVICDNGDVYDMETRQLIRNDKGKYNPRDGVFPSPDGKSILAKFDDKEEGRIWGLFDIATGTLTNKFKGDNPWFSRDGKLLAMRFKNNNFGSRLYDTATGQRIEQFKGDDAYRHALSSNATQILRIVESVCPKDWGKGAMEGKHWRHKRPGLLVFNSSGIRDTSYEENGNLIMHGRKIIPLSSMQKYFKSYENYDKLFDRQVAQVKSQIRKEQDEED